MRSFHVQASLLLVGVFCVTGALAQSTLDWPVGEFKPYHLDTGILANTDRSNAVVAYETAVTIEDAVWLRLYFEQVQLDSGSFIRITSAADGEVQELDLSTLDMWHSTSAYFNGDTVYLEVIAGPQTSANRLVLERVATQIVPVELRGPCADDDCGICGSDDRVLSSEDWSGRILPVGCTGSVYNTDSCVVSAGHCADGNYDDVIQFNVPSSSSSCYPNNPPVADQFPITDHMFVNGGVGNDWSVMLTGTNSQGQTPYERYGVYMPIAGSPASSGDSCEVWGYGVDNNNPTRSQVQQYSSGSISSRYSSYYEANLDITYGNSGSGLIHNGTIIGVVTHCSIGCPNYATRVDVSAFENAREQLCGGGSGGYCAASSSSTSYEHITNVSVGSINNSSGSSGYANYTSLSTDMQRGTGYPIVVTIDSDWSSDIGGLWIDWNQDEDFSDANETITTSWSGSGPTYSTTITPPTGAPLGSTRMRIRIQDGDYDPTLSSCGTTDYGEVEDYSVNVISGCAEPVFTLQPEPSQNACEGDWVSLTVAVDTLFPAYQWRRGTTNLVDGGHIAGATSATLYIFTLDESDEATNYNCVVTNVEGGGCSSTSNNAAIYVDPVPVITDQPDDVVAAEGTAANFSVSVENPVLHDFQWRKNGANLVNGGRISGATTATLWIAPLELSDAGEYDCVVTYLLGAQCATTSNAATLTVNPAGNDCPEDLVPDNVINIQDLALLLSHYGMSGATPEDGDFDGDGDVDLSDLAQLLGVYGESCPTQ